MHPLSAAFDLSAPVVAPSPARETGPAGFGLPGERLAQRAAQRSFHALKACFDEAAATLEGRRGQWLRSQVASAQEPIDLWLLRGALTAALVAAEGVAMAGLLPDDGPTGPDLAGSAGAPAGGRVQRLAQARQRLERTLGEVFADRLDWPAADFSARAGVLQMVA